MTRCLPQAVGAISGILESSKIIVIKAMKRRALLDVGRGRSTFATISSRSLPSVNATRMSQGTMSQLRIGMPLRTSMPWRRRSHNTQVQHDEGWQESTVAQEGAEKAGEKCREAYRERDEDLAAG